MNKEKQKIIPEFRFPEFKNDGDWEIRSIEKNIDMISGIALKSKELSEDKSGVPILRGINITEGHIRHSQKIDRFYLGDTSEINKYLVDENDIVIGMDGSKVGKNVALVSKFDKGSILIQRVARIRAIDSDINYLYQNFISQRFITYVDNVNTSSGIPHISAKQIRDYETGFPPNSKEQQKIANCLSSLDNLITAETKKLEYLKDHKKGLLQQLFPAKSETKPQYRFPEFKNNDDWEETTLNKISESIFDGTHQTPKYTEKGIPFFSVENIVSGKKNKFISKEDYLYETRNNKPELGDILITRIGNIGYSKVIDWDFDFSIYVTLAVIKKSDFFISKYLNGYFQSSRYQNEIRSKSLLNAAPIKINMDELRKTEILLPSTKNEQQKIADCFSSADDLIEAQTNKIENLKTHKKGLMQQLFPNINSKK